LGGQKSPFPITLAIGLYNSLYYRTSRDTVCDSPVMSIFADMSAVISNAWLILLFQVYMPLVLLPLQPDPTWDLPLDATVGLPLSRPSAEKTSQTIETHTP